MTYSIETSVPIPARTGPGHRNPESVAGVIRKLMESPIGASVLFPPEKTLAARRQSQMIGGPAWCLTRKVDGGLRVWRVAEPSKAQR